MDSVEAYGQLKRQVRDELFRVHVAGGDGCPKCTREGATWTGCPVVDEFAIERIINVCNVGLMGMQLSAEREQRFIVSR
jgi:hypothetical protein